MIPRAERHKKANQESAYNRPTTAENNLIYLQNIYPEKRLNTYPLLCVCLGHRLAMSRTRTSPSSWGALWWNHRCARHGRKLHRFECRLLRKFDITVRIGMCGCNPSTVSIQKNHRPMVRIVAVGSRMRVSATHVS